MSELENNTNATVESKVETEVEAQQLETTVTREETSESDKKSTKPRKQKEIDLSAAQFPALKSQKKADVPAASWPISAPKPASIPKKAPVSAKPTAPAATAAKPAAQKAPEKPALATPKNAEEALALQVKLRADLGSLGEQIDAAQAKFDSLQNNEEEKAFKETLSPLSKQIDAARQKIKDVGTKITAKEGKQGSIGDVVDELRLMNLEIGPLLDDTKLLAAKKKDTERVVRDLESQVKTVGTPVAKADLERALKEAEGMLKQKDLHPEEVKKQTTRKSKLAQALQAQNEAAALQAKLTQAQETLEKLTAEEKAKRAELQARQDKQKVLSERLQTIRDASTSDAVSALYKERDEARAQMKKLADERDKKQEDFNAKHRPLITDRAAAKLRLDTLMSQKRDILAALKHYDQFIHKVVVTIDQDAVPAVIGKGGANITELREKVKADITVEGDGRITLRGDKSDVDHAKVLLDELIKEKRRVVLEIPFDSVMVGVLIGKGGSNIAQIQKDTGAELDVSESIVRVRGSEETVKAAKAIIENFLHENKLVLVEIPLPEDVVPAVIGAKGATITKIREESGARVEVAKESNVVTITGKEEMVEKAKAAIEAIVAERKKSRLEMKIAQDMIPVLIGTKGATINRIRQESGCRVDVAKSGADVVVLEGKEESVKKAEQLILELIRQTNEESIEIRFARDHLDVIFGRGGNNIRQLRTQSGADIQVNTMDLVLTIRGTKEKVTKAREMLEAIMRSSADASPTGIIPFDAERIGVLIGKEGSTIQRIQRESGADSIKVDRTKGVVNVFGTREALEKAKELIAEIVATLPAPSPKSTGPQLTFQLESDRYLGAVFGRGGENLRALEQEFDVKVDVEKPSRSGPVNVNVRGKTEESLNGAKAALLQTVEDEKARRATRPSEASTSSARTRAAADSQ